MRDRLPPLLAYVFGVGMLFFAACILGVALAGYLVHFAVRRLRQSGRFRAAPPAPSPKAEPPAALDASPPAPPPLEGASAWGWPYDESETRPEALQVPGHGIAPPAPRLYDTQGPTVPLGPPQPAPPWGSPERAATTLTTTRRELADQLEGEGPEGKAEAKSLRESASKSVPVPAQFRSPPRPPWSVERDLQSLPKRGDVTNKDKK